MRGEKRSSDCLCNNSMTSLSWSIYTKDFKVGKSEDYLQLGLKTRADWGKSAGMWQVPPTEEKFRERIAQAASQDQRLLVHSNLALYTALNSRSGLPSFLHSPEIHVSYLLPERHEIFCKKHQIFYSHNGWNCWVCKGFYDWKESPTNLITFFESVWVRFLGVS